MFMNEKLCFKFRVKLIPAWWYSRVQIIASPVGKGTLRHLQTFLARTRRQKCNISSEICSLQYNWNLGKVCTARCFIFIQAEWCTWFTARCFPAGPHWCFSAELQNRQLSGISLQTLYILRGAFSPQVVKYRLFISTLCSSGSELCVSWVKSLSETLNAKQHRKQTSPLSSYLADNFSETRITYGGWASLRGLC